jgi:hypothetical protein
MTADEVKECHDRIWAVREKARIWNIEIGESLSNKDNWFIQLHHYGGIGQEKTFWFKSEVNQFLKELE